MWGRCVGVCWGVGIRGDEGKCVGVGGEVWKSVLGCGGRCREVWRSVLGCGGKCGKMCWGRCGKVFWGVGKVRGRCGGV